MVVVAFVNAKCDLAAAVDAAGEIRMDFRSGDEAQNARIAADQDITIQHRSAGREGDGSMMASNKGATTRYLSIRCDDFCGDGEGVLLSMWVRMENHRDAKARCALSLKCFPKGKNDSHISLLSVPLAEDGWTLLSGWYYRGPTAGSPLEFKVSVEPGITLLLDDMVLIRSSIAQPVDNRSPLFVKGSNLTERDNRFVLHGMNLYGCSDDEKSDMRHETGSVTEDDYRDIAASGAFNCVRLSLWHKVFREDGGWELLKLHCLWARRHGLRIILDMHSPPGGYQSNGYRGSFWRSGKMQQDLMDFWIQAARIFKDDPVIAAFDIMNEPKPPADKDWLTFAASTLEAIRKAGWNRPVIIEASMLVDGWDKTSKPFNDCSVIYDTHFYTPWSFTYSGESSYGHSCADYGKRVLDAEFIKEHIENDLLAFAKKNNVPVNIGEYGVSEKALAAGGEKWLADVLGVMNEHGINRQYFCWCVYGDFAIEPCWFRQSPPRRRELVLGVLKESRPQATGQQSAAADASRR